MTGKAIMPSLPKRNMKRGIHWNWSLGLVLAVLPLVGGSSQESLNQSTNTPPAALTALAPGDALAPAAADVPAPAAEAATNTDVVDAPAKPISTAKPLPAAVRPTAPVAEVLKLADSGVEEGVMLAFVTNSTSTFNLGAEEIIYLNDIGVPSEVVTAMIQRDQALKASFANAAAPPATPPPAPAEPPPAAPEPAPAPAPADMAPQPDSTAENYPPPADNTYAPFYDSLAPYGTWVDVAGYGPCWQPTVVIVNPGWQPYCNGGNWVYTDCGWYWRSGYSWGWAPFHYGRWFRHNHYGWCWMPGNTWGPSWVSWRYSGNYFGWAPLPPAAGYTAGVGLTYHGHHVSGSFAFGLGVNSYTFVAANHFTDHHLNHYALSHDHAKPIYDHTTPSTTFVGHGTRIVNHGIPVSHVAAVTGTQIHPIGIHDMHSAGAPGLRGDRLEANNRTLSVFRPQFPQSTGTKPIPGGHQWSDSHQLGGKPVAMPARAAPSATPAQPTRASGGSPATHPSSGGGSGRRSDRSANSASTAPVAPAGSEPTLAHSRSEHAQRVAQPLVLHGPDRSREPSAGSGASALHPAASADPLIIRGNNPPSHRQSSGQSSPSLAEVPQPRPTAPHQDAFSRPTGTARTHPFTIAEAERQTPIQSHRSTSWAAEPPARSERPWQPAAPAYRAPTEAPRSVPAPSYTPPRAQSYSPPSPSPAPRPEPAVSQPVHSTPSAPSASAPAAHSHSSSDRGRR